MIYLTKSMTMQKAVYEFISQQNNLGTVAAIHAVGADI